MIKSAINYTGNKYRLLNQILPKFPNNINNFIDLFCGSCNVSINTKANNIICNDIQTPLIKLYKAFQSTSNDKVYEHIQNTINQFKLSKTNQQGYLELRQLYNKHKNPLDLYVLLCYSFNNQIRFNSKMEFNMPFGKDRSEFNQALSNRLNQFLDIIRNFQFIDKQFYKLDYTKLNKQDLIYLDSPYYIGVGSYNDGKRGLTEWSLELENKLYEFVDNANQYTNFALSNVIQHKNQTNYFLSNWIDKNKYHVYYLDIDYSNCNYQVKNKINKTKSVEILVTNY